jgi:hypothetical protein
MEVCQPRNSTYNIGDSKQCDKFYQCTKAGKTYERLCPDGFMYSLEIAACDYPHNVNCTARPALQPSLSTNPQCPRSNGFYEFPPSDSCQKFYHCLEGQAYEKTCPEGVIFDPAKGACIHPDMSKRPDCAAKSVLNFTCPNSLHRFAKLKFGDHDRHSHPTDCRKFFICLKDGKPRVGGCPLGRVFNGKTGFCDAPKRVPNCKDYYGKRDPEKLVKQADTFKGEYQDDDSENEIADEADGVKDVPSDVEEEEEQQTLPAKQQQQQQPGANRKPKFNKVSKREAEIAQEITQGGAQKDSSEVEGQKDSEVKESKNKKKHHRHHHKESGASSSDDDWSNENEH